MINFNIDEHAITLTPNRRLAATLHKIFAEQQSEACWETPTIMPMNTWLEQLWQDHTRSSLLNNNRLLDPIQEQFLWEKVISESEKGNYLLRISETAAGVKQANMLAAHWLLDIKDTSFEQNADSRSFKLWLENFKNRCSKTSHIDSSQMHHQLISMIEDKTIRFTKKIILTGFADLSPLQEKLLNAIRQNGGQIEVYRANNENHSHSAHYLALEDSEDEIYTAARWAKQLHLKDNNAQIGCVIPNLDRQRDRVLQIFSEVFNDSQHYEYDLNTLPFNISAGKKLTQYAIIQTALSLLNLTKPDVSRETFSHILTSPFIGDANKEKSSRFRLDQNLRERNQHQFNLKDAVDEKNDNHLSKAFANCPTLKNRFNSFYQKLNTDRKSFYQWSLAFNELLSLIGWPGDRSLSSEEYQTVDTWMKLLKGFASFDQVSTEVSFNDALHILGHLASKSIFQPESPESNIQILGVLEAASLPFDYLWVCGMDDYTWPNQASPNPFLPKKLQAQAQVPHANAERELYYCKQLLRQFSESSRELIYSFAKRNGDIEQKISPLLKDLSQLSKNELILVPFTHPAAAIYNTRSSEKITDNQASGIDHSQLVNGGSDILKQQALCPFKAFSKHRLKAKELEKSQPGLQAKDKGNIIHKILELFWHKTKDQETLIQYSNNELDSLVSHCIDESFRYNTNHYYLLNSKYIQLEKSRLKTLIHSWLSIEKQRDYFSVIANEQKANITIDNLTLNLRVDRIDQLASGKYMVIDYKTGKNNQVSSWLGERPEEPQLPIYALLDEDKISALSFAQITSNAMKFQGLSGEVTDIKGVRVISDVIKDDETSWQSQVNEWKATFDIIAQEFCRGIATVDPKSNQTCNHCALDILCRIKERNNHLNDEQYDN